MKYLTFFLSLISSVSAEIDEKKLYNFCTDSIDELSYELTHNFKLKNTEKSYLVGEMQCLSEIIFLLDKHYFDKERYFSLD